jgi:hypothetical protein
VFPCYVSVLYKPLTESICHTYQGELPFGPTLVSVDGEVTYETRTASPPPLVMDTYSAGTLPRVCVGDNMVGQEVAIWQDITCAEGALDLFPLPEHNKTPQVILRRCRLRLSLD